MSEPRTYFLPDGAPRLDTFLTQDDQGRNVPSFIIHLADRLQAENLQLLEEQRQLSENVDHIKGIVNMQQDLATVSGYLEQAEVRDLVEEVLRLNRPGLAQDGIQVSGDYEDLPSLLLDRHRILQILVNLVQNARRALADREAPEQPLDRGHLHIRCSKNPESLFHNSVSL